MCCFSRPVELVAATRIFARPVAGGRQVIIYSMELGAPEDLAMILPISVALPSHDDAVNFVNLEGYPRLFNDMEKGFEEPPAATLGRSRPPSVAGLKVVNVGSFVASFVPRVRDFSRLDPQFRLPSAVWEKLNQYADYGFAVFQLRRGHARIHPMAFTFPRRHLDRLFFPTVHIHDGKVHPRADFDHILYCQVSRSGQRALADWRESDLPAGRFVDRRKARDLVVSDHHVFRRQMKGTFANEDVLLAAA